jgi:hypothetical protein
MIELYDPPRPNGHKINLVPRGSRLDCTIKV